MKLPNLILFSGLLVFTPLTNRAAEPLDTWTPRSSPTNVNLTAVAYGNGKFVAIGDYYGIALTSPDGVTWTEHSMPIKNRYFHGGAFGNGTFVTVGDVGKIMSSPDGINWTAQVSGSSANLASVTFLNNQFLALGNSGAVLTSPNGSNWTSHVTATTNQWRGATYVNGRYLLVGFNSPLGRALVGTSSDLVQINRFPPGFDQYYSCVAHGAGRYVAGGFGGYVLTSPNGTTWNTTNRIHFEHINDLAFQDNVFVAAANAGKLMTSPTGTNWTLRAQGMTTRDLNAVAYGNGTLVVVGDAGTILQSGSFGPAPDIISLSQVAKVGNQVSFKFPGTVGQIYQVQGTTNFVNWTALSNITCTASPMNCSLGGQTALRRFYRVVKL